MSSIFLNGTSSSGKSSIARAIQKLSLAPYIHLQVDMILGALHWESPSVSERQDECLQTCITNFHKSLPVFITPPFYGIIDHVVLREDEYKECLDCLSGLSYVTVGVRCPLEALIKRELDRGDRKIGLAARQFDKVHSNREYDIEVDTSTMTPEQAAEIILNHIKELPNKSEQVTPRQLSD